MSRDRGLLVLSRVGEFSEWLTKKGWGILPHDRFKHEVLRAYHHTRPTIVLYARAIANKHCTVHGEAVRLVKEFIKETRG